MWRRIWMYSGERAPCKSTLYSSKTNVRYTLLHFLPGFSGLQYLWVAGPGLPDRLDQNDPRLTIQALGSQIIREEQIKESDPVVPREFSISRCACRFACHKHAGG